jgi:hypothetical protein
MTPPRTRRRRPAPARPLRETEEGWQEVVIDLARLMGWRVAHFRPARTAQGWRTPVAADGAGFPDLVLVRERVIFVELKAQDGKVSPDQLVWLGALEIAGAEVHVWRPSDWEEVQRALSRPRGEAGERPGLQGEQTGDPGGETARELPAESPGPGRGRPRLPRRSPARQDGDQVRQLGQ